ncbi:phosphate acetyltransferase [Gallaecimonas sp. GXIMD4217]|uniref:phosphate acetyltransferase n=1 Tax=Gallaecimonas sp. GXIMD4217 TaxID=3131927 RepID=UPI00311AECE3
MRTILLVPAGTSVGLTSVSLGLVRALEREGTKAGFYKPIAQPRRGDTGPERSTAILRNVAGLNPPEPLSIEHVESLIGDDDTDSLLEEIVARYNQLARESDVVVIEGLVPTRMHSYAHRINHLIARALDAEVVLVVTPGADGARELEERIEVAASHFGGLKNRRLLGAIINKVNAPVDAEGRTRPDLSEIFDYQNVDKADLELRTLKLFSSRFKLLGSINWQPELISPRGLDLARHLDATVLNKGALATRRLRSVVFGARSLANMVPHLKPGALLVTSGDRSDVITAACLATMNGMELGALLLTGGYQPEAQVLKLCQGAFEAGLPVLMVPTNTWQTSLNVQSFNLEVPVDDTERQELVMNAVADQLDRDFINQLSASGSQVRRLSPPAFRHMLTEKARGAHKRIVLPEGDEPRTVRAAAICAERGIARCVLLAKPDAVLKVAQAQGVTLGDGIDIVDPDAIRERYVAPMMELRKGKGLEAVMAREQLKDNVVLGTMMLAQDEVDGLVSGAVHTTANTIRPPLQLIKTAPGASLVSSVFFMLLPEQVLVYGDCAINPNPSAEQLAEIAIQSADSAQTFGIEPRVAMISYSTGDSGSGSDVDKVRQATLLAKQKRPDLAIDGPLQYDAAVIESVARAKAPDSPVAGQATVFIFPDLNTGNTTYKAVQRSADLVSIGPMLQGMKKPVNDLSRGALVEDIVYTIALTAIQATQ